jgi:serine protease Do
VRSNVALFSRRISPTTSPPHGGWPHVVAVGAGVAVIALGFVSAVWAAAESGDSLGLLEQQAFREAVQRVAPSVVRIETVGGMERVGDWLFGVGPTTGLVLGADGTIVSSAFNFLHRPASIVVRLADGTRKAARLVATDHNRMIVLLKIDVDKPLPVPEIAPLAEMRVGQWTIAVGRAFEADQPNLAIGVLSATQRIWGKAIQTDAAVSPNNYGGPLVDIRGRVLGVLVPLSPTETSPIAGVEWYDSGIGFAVPAETILELLPRLQRGTDLYPGLTGIHIPLEKLYTADSTVSAVRPGSPAYRAGFRAGDRITQIDGKKVETAAQVKHEIARRYAGDKIRVTAVRGTEVIERDLELVARIEPCEHPFLGILPMRVARRGDKPTDSGLKVRYVYPESPAAKAGIQIGDVLISAGGKALGDLAQWRLRLLEFQPGDELAVEVQRGDQRLKVVVVLGNLPLAVPTGPLPPAHELGNPKPAARPPVGIIRVNVADRGEPTWAYVPETYDAERPCGVVVWLPPPGEFKPEAILALWKGPCDRDQLILAVPRSLGPVRWQTREARLIPPLVSKIAEQYSVDANRVVVCGAQSGGTVAMAAGFRYAQLVRGVVAVDAPAEAAVPEPNPTRRLEFYLATATQSRAATLVRQTIAQLRQWHYPVIVKDLGKQPRDLTADEVAELARWIDTLDRI